MNNIQRLEQQRLFFHERHIQAFLSADQYITRSNSVKEASKKALKSAHSYAQAQNPDSLTAASVHSLNKKFQIIQQAVRVMQAHNMAPNYFVTIIGFNTHTTRSAAYRAALAMKNSFKTVQSGLVCIEIKNNKGQTSPYEPHLHILLNAEECDISSLRAQFNNLTHNKVPRAVVFKKLRSQTDQENAANYLSKHTQTYSDKRRSENKPSELLAEYTVFKELNVQLDDLFFTIGDLQWNRQTHKFSVGQAIKIRLLKKQGFIDLDSPVPNLVNKIWTTHCPSTDLLGCGPPKSGYR